MPRQVRIEFEGALYHVMARGNQRNCIFASPDGGDESLFLGTLGECCERSGFRYGPDGKRGQGTISEFDSVEDQVLPLNASAIGPLGCGARNQVQAEGGPWY
jgi:hypothetical protein